MAMDLCRRALWLSPVLSLVLMVPASAQSGSGSSGNKDGRFSLAYANQDKGTETAEAAPPATVSGGEGRLSPGGPIDMRSTDPTPVGELEWKNVFGWSTSRNGEDDDYEYELELEYGLVENHELLLSLPVEIGDGEVEGNADITVGWHWRFVEEEGDMPSLGMRNFFTLPTGVHSHGVDYRWVGLISKNITDKARLHFNPFIEVIDICDSDDDDDDGNWNGWGWGSGWNNGWNGWNDGDDGERGDFVWGAIIGADYAMSPDFAVVWDYVWRSGDVEGLHDQHALQVGFEWAFADHQKLAMTTNVGLDGDGEGEALGAQMSYIIAFGG